MAVQVLYNAYIASKSNEFDGGLIAIESAFNKSGENPFTDVADDAWYAEAVAWAYWNGLVEGYGDGRFGPNDPVTREQFAKMVCKVVCINEENEQCNSSTESNLKDEFNDYSSISEWAHPYVYQICRWQFMSGYENGTFKPKGYITRAEVATVIYNYSNSTFLKSMLRWMEGHKGVHTYE
jgi:hypothetical protein